LIDSRDVAVRVQREMVSRLGVEPVRAHPLGVRFRLIPPGRFSLGARAGDPLAQGNEQPRRTVRIDRPFWLATFPLTNDVVRQFIEEAPQEAARILAERAFAYRCRRGEGPDDAPAVQISACDVAFLCAWM